MYFVYPTDTIHCAKSVTRQLSLSELHCFPRDFFFSSVTYQAYYRKVFLINRGEKLSYGVVLEDYHNCCGQSTKEYFFANVSLLGEEFLEFDSIILGITQDAQYFFVAFLEMVNILTAKINYCPRVNAVVVWSFSKKILTFTTNPYEHNQIFVDKFPFLFFIYYFFVSCRFASLLLWRPRFIKSKAVGLSVLTN